MDEIINELQVIYKKLCDINKKDPTVIYGSAIPSLMKCILMLEYSKTVKQNKKYLKNKGKK